MLEQSGIFAHLLEEAKQYKPLDESQSFDPQAHPPVLGLLRTAPFRLRHAAGREQVLVEAVHNVPVVASQALDPQTHVSVLTAEPSILEHTGRQYNRLLDDAGSLKQFVRWSDTRHAEFDVVSHEAFGVTPDISDGVSIFNK